MDFLFSNKQPKENFGSRILDFGLAQLQPEADPPQAEKSKI